LRRSTLPADGYHRVIVALPEIGIWGIAYFSFDGFLSGSMGLFS